MVLKIFKLWIISHIATAVIQKQLDNSFCRLYSLDCQGDVVVITYSTDLFEGYA